MRNQEKNCFFLIYTHFSDIFNTITDVKHADTLIICQ